MRHVVLRLARSFGTQSDKDFFFHNLAKTGEVARPLPPAAMRCLQAAPPPLSAPSACVLVVWPHALVAKCADTRRHRRATLPRPTPSARRSLTASSPPPPCSFHALNCLQVLILYRDIIRTARVMTHKDNGAALWCSSVWQRAPAPTQCSFRWHSVELEADFKCAGRNRRRARAAGFRGM